MSADTITIQRNPGLLPASHTTTPTAAPLIPMETAMRKGHFLSVIAFNGAITAETTNMIMAMQASEYARTQGRRGMWAAWKFHQGEGQVRARNECSDVFLKTGLEKHLYLDADVMPRPEHLHMLREHPEADEHIICGLYAKKEDRVTHCCNTLPGEIKPNAKGLVEIARGGTGCMQIPRAAYVRIMKKFPERFYKCDYDRGDDGKTPANKFSFFFHDIRMDHDLGYLRDMSEDWAFCELARAAGVKIFADVRTTLWETGDKHPILHKGLAIYPLRTELERCELEEKLATATAELAALKRGAA